MTGGHLTPIKQRLQITFGKYGALKYSGSVDIAKVWERVLRRADLPILYTQGFNTRPRMQLAATLPIGVTSDCEILDVSLREQIPALEGLPQLIHAVSPTGLRVNRIENIHPESPPVQTLVRSAIYRIRPLDEISDGLLQQKVEETLAAERIVKVSQRKRKGKVRKMSTDLRPMIHEMMVDESGDIIAHLAAGERGNLIPQDLLAEIGLGNVFFGIHRMEILLDQYHKEQMAKRTDGINIGEIVT